MTTLLEGFLERGTHNDKVDAIIQLCESDMFFRLEFIDQLVESFENHARHLKEEVNDRVSKFFKESLPDDPLTYLSLFVGFSLICVFRDFFSQPILHPNVSLANIVVWYFEHKLKLLFDRYVKKLQDLSQSMIPYLQKKVFLSVNASFLFSHLVLFC